MNEAAIDAEGTSVPTETSSVTEEVTQATEEATESTETEAKAEGSSEEGESGDAPNEDEAQQKRNGFQQRIKQLTDRAKEAEQKAKEFEERVKAYEQTIPQDEIGPPPSLEDFDYDSAAYQQAMMEYSNKVQQKTVNDALTQQQRFQAQAAREQAQREAMMAFQERQNAFADEHPDYREVVRNYQVQTPHVAEAIVLSENGPALAYHLGSNPATAASLETMPVSMAMMELGRLSAQLSSPPPVTTTQTPNPATPVKPTGSVQKDPDKMTPKEYANWRNKQLGLA
jgi:hypothetical protein